MKHICFLLFLMIVPICLTAVHVNNLPMVLVQPDKSQIECYISGDEFSRTIHDAEGYTIIQNVQTGYYEYAIQNNSLLIPSGKLPGKDDPSKLYIQPNLKAVSNQNSRQETTRTFGAVDTPSIGTLNQLLVFVKFSGQSEFPESFTSYNTMYNSDTEASVKTYLKEISNNQLTVTTTLKPNPSGSTIVSYTDSHIRGYFLPYSATNTQGYTSETELKTRWHTMMYNAFQYVSSQVSPSLDLDYNNDGYMDMATMIFRGDVDTGGLFWPMLYYYQGTPLSINSALLEDVAFEFEEFYSMHLGTICHETLHFYGFPDLYHASNSCDWPLGMWDVMDSPESLPSHPVAYAKWKYGHWFTSIPVISGEGTYSLQAITDNPFACIKVPLPASTTEYFVIEFRRKEGLFHNILPASGMLIYRINTLAGDGNYLGPLDEIYLFRPGDAWNMVRYAPFNYRYDLSQGVQSFHQYSPLTQGNRPNLSDGTFAGVNFFGMSWEDQENMSFILKYSCPHIFDPDNGTDWFTASNWLQGTVPNSTNEVYLPQTGVIYTTINSGNAFCNNIFIDRGCKVKIQSRTMSINGDLLTEGWFFLEGTAHVSVAGDLTFMYFSNITSSDDDIQLSCYGNLTWEEGSAANIPSGYLNFYGSTNSILKNYKYLNGCHNLRVAKTGGANLTISSSTTQNIRISGNIENLTGSSFYNHYSGEILLLGSVYNSPGADFKWHYGTLHSFGTDTDAWLSLGDAGNYIHNLFIERYDNGTLFLLSDIIVENDITGEWGNLSAGSFKISIGGIWNMGTTGDYFVEGTSRVAFYGDYSSSIQNNETFNILELNKTGGTLTIGAGVTVTCNTYDWTAGDITINGGNLTALDLADDNINGNFTLVSGNVNLTQDSGGFCSLAGNLTIQGGIMDIHGGFGYSSWPVDSNASITMSGGVLNIHDIGLNITNYGTLTENITGGEIHLKKSFMCNRADFTPTGGTIYMDGTSDAILTLGYANLNNFIIDKAARNEVEGNGTILSENKSSRDTVTRSSIVSIGANSIFPNSFTFLSGTLKLNGKTLTTPTSFPIYGTLMMDNATDKLIVNGYISFQPGSVANITDGDIECTSFFRVESGANVIIPAASSLTMKGSTSSFQLFQVGSKLGAVILAGTAGTNTCGIFTGSIDPLVINGNLTINANNTLDLTNGNLTVGGDINLNGTLMVNNRTVTLTGKPQFVTGGVLTITTGTFRWNDNIAPRTTSLAGTINLGSGILDAVNHSLSVALGLNFTVTTGTIKCDGFSAVTASTFSPTTGTVEITTNPTATYGLIAMGTGNSFANLTISANPGVKLNSDIVQCSGNVNIQGSGGRLDLEGKNFKVLGNLTVKRGAKLNVDSGSYLQLASGKSLTVNSEGFLLAIGEPVNNAQIGSISGSITYLIQAGGFISAENCIFRNMNADGIQVLDGAIVDTNNSFTNCTFTNGMTSGCYLLLNNNQTIVIVGANFPSSLGILGGNVAKTINQGMVYMINAIGAYSGEVYDKDHYSLIQWGVLPPVMDLNVSLLPNGDAHLDWSYPFTPTGFNIYSSSSADLTSSPMYLYDSVSGSQTEYNEPATSEHRFYLITAEQ